MTDYQWFNTLTAAGWKINDDYCPICNKYWTSFVGTNREIVYKVIRQHFRHKNDLHKIIYDYIQSVYDKYYHGQLSDSIVRKEALKLSTSTRQDQN